MAAERAAVGQVARLFRVSSVALVVGGVVLGAEQVVCEGTAKPQFSRCMSAMRLADQQRATAVHGGLASAYAPSDGGRLHLARLRAASRALEARCGGGVACHWPAERGTRSPRRVKRRRPHPSGHSIGRRALSRRAPVGRGSAGRSCASGCSSRADIPSCWHGGEYLRIPGPSTPQSSTPLSFLPQIPN